MSSFIIAVNAVLPLFLVIGAGYLARRAGLLEEAWLGRLNRLIFTVLLSTKLFWSVYTSDFRSGFGGGLMTFLVASTLISYAVIYVLVVCFKKENAKRGVMIQALYRSNFIILGVPIAVALAGESCEGTASAVAAVAVPLGNILAVFTLQRFSENYAGWGGLIRKIATNPLILGTLAALLVRLAGIHLPVPVASAVSSVAAAATPMALLVLGGFFHLEDLKGRWRDLSVCLVGKLILIPVIMLTIAVLLGFRGADLAVILAYFAAPCGPTSYTMAREIGGDTALVSGTVVLGSICASVTLTILAFLLVQFGYL